MAKRVRALLGAQAGQELQQGDAEQVVLDQEVLLRVGGHVHARSRDAVLAVRREDMDEQHPFSLSPGSMCRVTEGTRLVLPSPNGATLSLTAAEYDIPVIAGCLRNASAVAKACAACGGPVVAQAVSL